MKRSHFHRCRYGWFLSVIILTVCSSVQADFIFLKDGFVLQGRLLKQYDTIMDPSGIQVAISKLGGFYLVDDGVRRTYFPTNMVGSTEAIDRKSQLEQFRFNPTHLQWQPSHSPLKPYAVIKNYEWSPQGTRSLDVYSASAKNVIQVDQAINSMTPHAVEVVTKRYTRTYSSFLTQEFEADKALAMLRTRIKAEAAEAKRDVSFDDKLRVARFAAQAGWFEQALTELNSMAQDHPSELQRLNEVRQDIKRSQMRLRMEELDDAIASGQHTFAQTLLSNLDQDAADTQDLTRLSLLRTQYKDQQAALERLRKHLSDLRQNPEASTLARQYAALLDEMDRDLNLDNAKVLSVFLKMADQEERLASRKQSPVTKPDQLLSLALTGWMSGTEGADSGDEASAKLARHRELIKQFLLTDDYAQRKSLIENYLKASPLRADEAVQLIDQLPPPRAEAVSKSILDLTTSPSKNWSEGVKYRVYLPPEYHHHRAYPVILLLPNLGQTFETATMGWLTPAARKGFIVAVPEWVDGQKQLYEGTDKEQEAVLETLRDLRRRFRIDSNRVSLAGYSTGGSLVFDVALTRPHLFASASVICGHAPDDIEKLRYNAQYLPFYIVDASKNRYREKIGPAKKDAMLTLFEYWIPKGYPSLLVEYQGRGFEYFPAEIPYIVDWMSRKKRTAAMPDIGRADLSGNRMGQEFRIVRPSASRFYWIEVEEHKATPQSPVLVSAGWEKDVPNSLRCVMSGMKKAKIWLNASMINFENPVEIRIQGPAGASWQSQFKKKIEPNVAVLLEDYYQRGDSKNLFTQCIEFTFSR